MNIRSKPAFCYVTDLSYLAPTLTSIASLRKTLSANLPIFLVLTLKTDEKLPDLGEVCERLSITVVQIEAKSVEDLSVEWAESHVPKAALGRLLLDNIIPSDIDRIVYLDGDTFVTRDLSSLAFATIPHGCAGMVEDAMSFYRRDNSVNGRFTREYLGRIGLKPETAYGNSGVMIADRSAWKDISIDAIAYLKHYSDRCTPYHDQSAINAVIGDRRVNLSTKWNCQSRLAQWDARSPSKASLLHFTGAEKPWMGTLHPWQSISAEFLALKDSLQIFGLPIKTMSTDEVAKHNAQYQGPKYLIRKLIDVRLRHRNKLISEYNQGCRL